MDTPVVSSSSRLPVVLTGLQPTSGIQLGNYLGALRNWKAMQRDYECYFFIADMHAITVPQVPADLRRNVLDCVALYMACGLDPKSSKIFLQSQVVGHAELMWVLSCLCSVGQLERMTQFKDKSQKQASGFVGSGLLYYPILMAADILLYQADLVPIGEDQKQHLELTRDLAQKFNHTYSETFPVPEPFVGKSCARVMSLQNPSAKMSKSDPNPLATIFLLDEDDRIRKKIRSAVTDSGKEIVARADKPGISNLLDIYSALSGESITLIEKRYRGKSYGEFKEDLAELVVETIRPIRERFSQLREEKNLLLQVLEEGRQAAQIRANRVLSKVYKKVGFLPSLEKAR